MQPAPCAEIVPVVAVRLECVGCLGAPGKVLCLVSDRLQSGERTLLIVELVAAIVVTSRFSVANIRGWIANAQGRFLRRGHRQPAYAHPRQTGRPERVTADQRYLLLIVSQDRPGHSRKFHADSGRIIQPLKRTYLSSMLSLKDFHCGPDGAKTLAHQRVGNSAISEAQTQISNTEHGALGDDDASSLGHQSPASPTRPPANAFAASVAGSAIVVMRRGDVGCDSNSRPAGEADLATKLTTISGDRWPTVGLDGAAT